MNTKNLKSYFESIREKFAGQIEFDAPLAKATYYQIGGPAEVLVTPKSFEDLRLIQEGIAATRCRLHILGWGSNMLIADEGLKGITLRMKQLFPEIEKVEEGLLRVGASVGGSTLLRRAQREGWGGLAHLTGIPGSVGGMVQMNAGTHLGEWKDCATYVEFITLSADEFSINNHEVTEESFGYRKNNFLSAADLVTHAEIRYRPEDPAKVEAEINHLYTRRKETQPVDLPSCGSVFMNPKASGLHAWQVIEELGLRGHQIGMAQFSPKHCNFIVNLGGAQAADVKALIELAKERAFAELGIDLHEEVKYIE